MSFIPGLQNTLHDPIGQRSDLPSSLGATDFAFANPTPNTTSIVVGDPTYETVQWRDGQIEITLNGQSLAFEPYAVTSVTAANGHVELIGPSAGATFDGNGSDCLMLGGPGDDTFLLGYGGNDWINGGAGNNQVIYSKSADSYTVTLSASNSVDGGRNDQVIQVRDNVTGGVDQITSVESIRLGTSDNPGENNFVVVKSLVGLPTPKDATTIDLGATLYSSNDTLDFTQFGKNVYLGTTTSTDRKGQAAGLYTNKTMTASAGLSFTGMTTLTLGSDDDTVNLSEAADPYLHTINTGGGKNSISSGNINVTINLQGSDDTVEQAGKGSTVNVGQQTHATIELSDDVLVIGLKATDSVTFANRVLHGAIGSANSETGWVTNGDGIYYGINTEGQLAIRQGDGKDGRIMYVAGYNGGPGVPLSQQTGGIFIGVGQTYAWQLFNGVRPSIGKADTDFKAANDQLFTLGLPRVFNADPLVLDLTGSGINLTAVSPYAPMVDVNADGFLVHTGWVGPTNGILIDDKNGNGLVDNAREMFGGPGTNGFAALAQGDANADGVIDAKDAIFSELKVWRDLNGNGVVNSGEMESLADAGIASINLSATAQIGVTNAGNTILSTGTFTRTDGTTSAIDDVSFNTDPYHSVFAGDKSVSAAAAAMPNIKGYGTLTDLRVAMTLDPHLIDIVKAGLDQLISPDLTQLRAAAMPIFTAWAAAVPLRDADGNWHAATPASHPGIAYLASASSPDTIMDFAYQVTEGGVTFWKLASGADVRDSQSNVIAHPTLAEVLNQQSSSGQWTMLSGAEIAFMERYRGVPLPLDSAPTNPHAMISAMSGFISASVTALNLEAVRLAMQGPLASYFQGLSYDTATDKFHATTDLQLTPMFEAIFAHAPADAAGASAWIASWRQLLDIVLGDLDRGQLTVSYAYMFQSMVRAYEAVNLPISITDAASALGVPANEIVEGGSVINGTSSTATIYYLHGGDQTVTTNSLAPDNFIMGGTFGHVVINADRGSGEDDLLRFTNVRSTDVTADRDGKDLILTVNGTNEQIRVVDEFTGIKPGLFGGNLNPKTGVQQIVFSDGVVWDKSDIATAASHPRPDLAVLTGTDDHDVLDGGVGGDTTLIGGDSGDTYVFGRGYGHDTVDDEQGWIFNDEPDIVKFKPGITLDDLKFSRDGNSDDLNIAIKGTTDKLTIHNEFSVSYNVWNSETNRIELFEFSDGTQISWEDVIQTLDAQGWGQPAIYGVSYPDALDGGPGVHYLSGGNEDDTYTFDVGYAYDVVADAMSNIFAGDNDTIQFGADIRPQDVTFSLLQGSREDLAITLSDGSTMIVQREFAKDIFNISWNRIENFRFADGTILTYDQVRQQLLSAAKTTGNDVITGTDYADVLDGGAGNDYLAGTTGDTTYVFGHGYGHDTIDANGGSVTFNADVSLSDITWSQLGTDLVIKLNGTNDSLNILGEFNNANVNAFRFADGTVLSRDDVQALLMHGIDNVITIGSGNNTVVYQRGDGFEKIVVNKASGDVDTLSLANIASTEVSLLRWAGRGINDLVIEIDGQNGAPQGQITIASEFDYGYTDAFQTQVNAANAPIQRIVFSDGVVWTEADIEARLLAQQNAQAGSGAAIYGFDGADTLYAGKAARTLIGGLGNDTYVWSAGDGPTFIDDHGAVSLGSANSNTLVIKGVNPADVTVTRSTDPNAHDLILTVAGQSPIVLKDQTAGTANVIEHVVFDDGTMWDSRGLLLKAIGRIDVDGQTGAISLTTSYNVVSLGTGDKSLSGGTNNIYIYSAGSGNDTVVDRGASAELILTGFSAGQVQFLRPNNGNDLVVKNLTTGASLTVQDYFTSAAFKKVGYDNGTPLSPSAMLQTLRDEATAYLISPAAATDSLAQRAAVLAQFGFMSVIDEGAQTGTLQATNGTDVIFAGIGAKTLQGNSGADLYVYGSAGGSDVIDDNSGTLVMRDIASTEVTLSRSGTSNDLVLTVAATGKTVTLDREFVSDVAGLAISFSDGVTWSREQIEQRLLDQASAGNGGLVYGYYGRNDTIVAGPGDKYLSGLTGDDTYIYARGDGNDTIIEDPDSVHSAFDTLKFQDINSNSVSLVRNGNDLTLLVSESSPGAGDGGSVLLKQELDENFSQGVEQIVFADGTAWSRADLRVRVLAQASTSGDDTIVGFNTADTIRGGAGNDTMNGGQGNDTYIYARRDGNDTIIEDADSGHDDFDTLRFENVNSSAISLVRNGIDITLVVAESAPGAGDGGSVLLKNELDDYFSRGVEKIVFADGTTWDRATLRTRLISAAGTDGNDTINGTNAADLIAGGRGDDTINGGQGDDTYLYARGDGNDTIIEGADSGHSDVDTLKFEDINSNAVSLLRNGNDLTLRVSESLAGAGDGGSVLLKQELDENFGQGVEQIVFADGTAWSRADLRLRVLAQASTSGDDTIVGFNTADTIRGSSGNDTMNGGQGDDTYVYARGDGTDTIIEDADSGHSDFDTLKFENINSNAVSLVRNGNDLTLRVSESLLGAGDGGSVLLKQELDEYFSQGVEQIVFADGTTWSRADLRVRVLAQASTSGDDTIVGFNTADTIRGGTGNDTMNGGQGDDTYIFARGDGNDTIIEDADSGHSDFDTLKFENINSSAVSLVRNGIDVTLVVAESAPGAGDGGSVLLKNELEDYYSRGVEKIVFADGTTWTRNDLRVKLLAQAATPGDDVINGFSADDTIQGGAGNDALNGGGGNDTYVYNAGDGNDVITEASGAGDNDRLVLGVGFTEFGTIVTRSGNDVTLSFVNQGGSIRLIGEASAGIEQIVFSDGTTWNKQTLLSGGTSNSHIINGTPGNDSLTGQSGDDRLTGGLGDDQLNGGTGSDTYVYSSGDGNDVITESAASDGSVDKLLFTNIASSRVSLVRNDTDVTLVIAPSASGAADGGSVILKGEVNGASGQGVEQIVFADGTTWSSTSLLGTLVSVAGTSGDDTLNGTSGFDIIAGRAGNDTLNGGSGNDAYIYARGDGNDVITEGQFAGSDSLVLQTINPNAVSMVRNGNDLTLVIAASAPGAADGGSVLLKAELDDNYSTGVERVLFDDGTIWTQADLRSKWLAQASTAGNDVINGFNTNDAIRGGGGNDTLIGGSGNDTYIYARGDGNDVITEASFEGTTDSLVLQNINPTAVSLVRNGNDMKLVVAPSSPGGSDGGSVLLKAELDDYYNQGVERVVFDDGTVWAQADLRTKWLAQASTSGDDVINGFNTNDTIRGGGGNDTLDGGSGNDTYVYNAGDGNDAITEGQFAGGADSLVLGAGLTPSDMMIGRSGNDVTLSFVNEGGSIKLIGEASGYGSGVEQIVFGDGTIWSQQTLLSIASTVGTTGNNILYGTTGNDTFDGHGGSDLEIGQGGNDHYIFNMGYGRLEVDNRGGNTAHGELDFGAGITNESLWFTQSGSDLLIQRVASSDQIKIDNWFGSTGAALSEIKLSDGNMLDAQLNQLVSAMATFAVSNPSFNPATATQMPNDPSLQSTIGAAWHA